MLYYIIPSIIIIVSLLWIFFLVIKKFPSLAAINIESIAKEKETKVKNRIMVERLSRGFFKFKKIMNLVFSPLAKSLVLNITQAYQKAMDLEKNNLKNQPLKKIDIQQEVTEKIEAAKKYLTERDFAKTEEICINILELDKKNIAAYEILAEIYLADRDYKKARETSRYLIKLLTKEKEKTENSDVKHRLANSYADLGYIYQLENRNSYALANFQKAVDLEPVNPRFLDLLLKISIILKNKNLAKQVFNDLKAADPENQKLEELKEEIHNLPDQPSQ